MLPAWYRVAWLAIGLKWLGVALVFVHAGWIWAAAGAVLPFLVSGPMPIPHYRFFPLFYSVLRERQRGPLAQQAQVVTQALVHTDIQHSITAIPLQGQPLFPSAEPPETGDEITVHMLGLSGYELETATFGDDLDEDSVTKFWDPSTRALYAMKRLKDGEPETYILAKAKWFELKKQLDTVGAV